MKSRAIHKKVWPTSNRRKRACMIVLNLMGKKYSLIQSCADRGVVLNHAYPRVD
jgi:hypothetical protein